MGAAALESPWVLPFTVVAEMRFGDEVAGWGARRRAALDRLVAAAGVMPPLGEVTDAYVDLRTWCVRSGHGLGGRDHEADRWVATVAIAAKLPLASEDSIFDTVPTLRRADRTTDGGAMVRISSAVLFSRLPDAR